MLLGSRGCCCTSRWGLTRRPSRPACCCSRRTHGRHRSKHPTQQELWLFSNHLTHVPPELGRLTDLRRLWLDRNALEAVPPELAGCTALQELYLDQNPALGEVPPALAALPALRKLYLPAQCAGQLAESEAVQASVEYR